MRHKKEIISLILVSYILGNIPCYATDNIKGSTENNQDNNISVAAEIANTAKGVLEAATNKEVPIDIESRANKLNKEAEDNDIKYLDESDYNDIIDKIFKDSLGTQLYDLISNIGNKVGLSYERMQILYDISGITPVYDSKNPNVELDATVKDMPIALTIGGIEPHDLKIADGYESPDPAIERPSKEYLPDVVYTVAYEIQELMQNRLNISRGSVDVVVGTTRRGKPIIQTKNQWESWDTVSQGVKENICFYEAILQYIGATEEQVNNFYNLYTSILNEKSEHGGTVYSLDLNGQTISTWITEKLYKEGYTDTQIDVINKLFDNDMSLIYSTGADDIIDDYELSYNYGEMTVENFAKVSMSLINRVRYVWGGGHGNASNIRGINPVWSIFNDYYNTTGHGNYCIMPAYTWCPIHGVLKDTEAACIGYAGDNFSNISKYIEHRERLLNTKELSTGQFAKQIRGANLTSTDITGHNLDGLDCSGFTCWVYNQLTGGQIIDSTSLDFIQMNNFEVLDKNAKLQPGDIFSWPGHIVMIVGPATNAETCKAYVIIEMSPTVVQLSVAYHSGVSNTELNEAIRIAIEGNKALGNLTKGAGDIHKYIFETMAQTNQDTGKTEIVKREYQLGRYTGMCGAKELQDYTAQDVIDIAISSMS